MDAHAGRPAHQALGRLEQGGDDWSTTWAMRVTPADAYLDALVLLSEREVRDALTIGTHRRGVEN